MQHAFGVKKEGTIKIDLVKNNKVYILTIEDDGEGFDASIAYESLGLVIIESLSTYQLHGQLEIDGNNGTKIKISWEDRDA